MAEPTDWSADATAVAVMIPPSVAFAVTAGVYMVVRSNVLFRLSPTAMMVVAIVGALTAIFAATIGLAQNDIKKVLAYSTVSQLGYMFLAAGVGAFTAAIFHVMTHAFFKACLFLGAGSVIHGCGGEQDMNKMGGLRKYMPSTHKTMLIATLAIAGIPPLAGFFSKDEILAYAFNYSGMLWFIGVLAATCTSFYMFRLYYMTFSHEYRGAHVEGIESSEPEHAGHSLIPDQRHLDEGDEHLDKGHGHHVHAHAPHESPASMTGVLWILAILSIIGGFYFGWPSIWGGHVPTAFQRWLEPVLLPLGEHHFHFHEGEAGVEWLLVGTSVFVALLGWFLAYSFYYRDRTWRIPTMAEIKLWPIHRMLFNKYYVDEIYGATVIAGTLLLSKFLWWFDAWIVDGLVNLTRHITVVVLGMGSSLFDRFVVDGAVNGVAATARGGSKFFRRVQSGVVQNYALIMGGGIVVIAVIYLFLKPTA